MDTVEENHKEDDEFSSFSEDAKELELAHHDSSNFSDDSMTAELTKPKSDVEILATHEELSEISSIDHFVADVQDNSSEKPLDVGVNGNLEVKSPPRPIVDYSDSENSDSIDDKSMFALRKGTGTEGMCQICGKQFRTVYVLNHHIAGFHLKLNKVTCDLCHMTFSRHQSLKIHMMFVHKVELLKEKAKRKWLRCKHCGQTFRNSRDLTAHYESIAMADI